MKSTVSNRLASAMVVGAIVLSGSPARADVMFTLVDVTFGDGATASGEFTLNVDGYVESVDIVTTGGQTVDNDPIPGNTYTSAAAYYFGQSPPFEEISFNSATTPFALIIDVLNPMTPDSSGADPLVPGSGSPGSFAGSAEVCTEGPSQCGAGITNLDGRLVATGELYVPEPASLTLLAAGSLLLPVLRRRRNRPADRGAEPVGAAA